MSKSITICGSMQFAKEMIILKKNLELQGWNVFLPEISEISVEYTKLPRDQRLNAKRAFITNHFDRIKKSDAILVANYEKKGIGGYIGSNTLMEIAVAYILKKEVFILNELGNQGCSEEVAALASRILNGETGLVGKGN